MWKLGTELVMWPWMSRMCPWMSWMCPWMARILQLPSYGRLVLGSLACRAVLERRPGASLGVVILGPSWVEGPQMGH